VLIVEEMSDELDRVLVEDQADGGALTFEEEANMRGALRDAEGEAEEAALQALEVQGEAASLGVIDGDASPVDRLRGEDSWGPDGGTVAQDRGHERVEEGAEALHILDAPSLALTDHGEVLAECSVVEGRSSTTETGGAVYEQPEVAELRHPLHRMGAESHRGKLPEGRGWHTVGEELGLAHVDRKSKLSRDLGEAGELMLEAGGGGGGEREVVRIQEGRDRRVVQVGHPRATKDRQVV
jgi:hypothetical protein